MKKLYLKSLVRGIDGIIPGGVSVKDFAVVAGTDQKTAKQILEELIENQIGKTNEKNFDFKPGDRLKSAIFALKKGADIDDVSEHLDWKDFEGLVAEILESKNFATIRNLMLKNPRMEIDVVGIKLGVAMLIDCKHWKRYSFSALNNAVKKQIQRTIHYVSQTQGAISAPVIVTLYHDKVDFINKVPIVPIVQFGEFVEEFYGNLDEIKTVETE